MLTRILFIYAKLNPGLQYIQGMNEILAVLYAVFHDDRSDFMRENMEADLFFTFTNLMAEIRDRFCRTLDQEESGITGKIDQFAEVIERRDPTLYKHLERHKIHPQFFSI